MYYCFKHWKKTKDGTKMSKFEMYGSNTSQKRWQVETEAVKVSRIRSTWGRDLQLSTGQCENCIMKRLNLWEVEKVTSLHKLSRNSRTISGQFFLNGKLMDGFDKIKIKICSKNKVESQYWMQMIFHPSGATGLKQVWFCSGHPCMDWGTLPLSVSPFHP